MSVFICAKAESCLCNICVYVVYELNMWIKRCYCFMCDYAACKLIWKCEKSINLLHHICLYICKSWVVSLQYVYICCIWIAACMQRRCCSSVYMQASMRWWLYCYFLFFIFFFIKCMQSMTMTLSRRCAYVKLNIFWSKSLLYIFSLINHIDSLCKQALSIKQLLSLMLSFSRLFVFFSLYSFVLSND